MQMLARLWALSSALQGPDVEKFHSFGVRLKLLVVEDETRMVELLRKGLAEEGHTVVCAGDGKEGLDLARNYEFDAIILDIMLPSLNGYDLAHQLRKKRSPLLYLCLLRRTLCRIWCVAWIPEPTIISPSLSPSRNSWPACAP